MLYHRYRRYLDIMYIIHIIYANIVSICTFSYSTSIMLLLQIFISFFNPFLQVNSKAILPSTHNHIQLLSYYCHLKTSLFLSSISYSNSPLYCSNIIARLRIITFILLIVFHSTLEQDCLLINLTGKTIFSRSPDVFSILAIRISAALFPIL